MPNFTFKHKITLYIESTETGTDYEDASATAYVSMTGLVEVIKKEFESSDIKIEKDDIEELEFEQDEPFPEDYLHNDY